MKVRITHDVNDETRRALRRRVGKPGLASRDEVVQHIEMVLHADIEVLCGEVANTSIDDERSGAPPVARYGVRADDER